jgi:hypothetical protein
VKTAQILLEDDFRQGLDLARRRLDALWYRARIAGSAVRVPHGGPNLFGQGTELHVERFEVRTDRISRA